MVWRFVTFVMISAFATMASAGVKEDFVETFVKSCGKSKDEGEKAATPGRSGNVVKWQMCKSGTVEIEGCNMACVDSSSKIGN